MIASCGGRLARSHLFRHLAQLELLHLAGGGLGQFGEHHVARAFVAGEILAAPGDEIVLAGALARLEPDDKWGETPCAFVELKPGENASKDDLIAWCRKNLASYKCPRYVVFAELPKTSTGKVQKFKLREMAKEV